MTTTRLNEWAASDEILCMFEQCIPIQVIKSKFKITASEVHRMVEHGRHRRELRTGVVDQIDPTWRLPVDVLIPTTTTITCVQEGCRLSTLLDALRARE
jgi:hypothetical protein